MGASEHVGGEGVHSGAIGGTSFTQDGLDDAQVHSWKCPSDFATGVLLMIFPPRGMAADPDGAREPQQT